uniref:Solute carrier family 25 member 47 n=1 Tax=Oncorhynchus kisutch TaxID=8019 RepID=A0A8C7F5N6_ONCKI
MHLADFVAGSIGGAFGVAVGYPLDTVKVNGFYRGMSMPVTTVSISSSVVFGVYRNVLQCLHQLRSTSTGLDFLPAKLDFFLSGLSGGVAQVSVMAPADIVKVRMQCQMVHQGLDAQQPKYRGPMHCLLTIAREEGFLGLYKGAGALALRDGPSFATYFTIYHVICEQLSPPENTQPGKHTAPENTQHLGTPSQVNTQHLGTPSQVNTQHLGTPSQVNTQHLGTPSQVNTQHLGTPSQVNTQHLGTPSQVDTQHLRTPSQVDTQHLRTPSQVNTQHLRTPSQVNTQHLRIPIQVDTQHLRTPSQVDTQHLGTPSQVDTKQLGTPSQVNTQHLGTPSQVNIPSLCKNLQKRMLLYLVCFCPLKCTWLLLQLVIMIQDNLVLIIWCLPPPPPRVECGSACWWTVRDVWLVHRDTHGRDQIPSAGGRYGQEEIHRFLPLHRTEHTH